MTDRQKVTSIREKADPCDSSRNGRDALGLSAGRRDLIEERSSVLLFFFKAAVRAAVKIRVFSAVQLQLFASPLQVTRETVFFPRSYRYRSDR